MRSLLVIIAVIAVIVAIVTYTAQAVNSVRRVVMDAYRVWGTGELLVDFMDAHAQRWPSSWKELETFYDQTTRHYTVITEFSDIRDHIEIDFDFDPAEASLANPEDDPPFRAIWLRNGTDSHYVGAGPNQIVYAHLKQLAEATAPSVPVDDTPTNTATGPITSDETEASELETSVQLE